MKEIEKSSKKTIIIRIILFILICIWAYIVFNFSSQNGDESSGLSRKVTEFFIKDEKLVLIVEPYVRKLAHFSEYALGGMLFVSLFSTFKWSDKRIMITSGLLGVWYAITDEFHQLLVPDRHGSIVDVYIDSLGFFTGVCVMMIILKIAQIIINKNGNSKGEIKK